MTPERFFLALVLFHAGALAACWRVAARWADPARCRLALGSWLGAVARDIAPLAILTYGVALAATVAANVDQLERLRLGAISGRLMGQALFGEAILLLGAGLAYLHRRAARSRRAR